MRFARASSNISISRWFHQCLIWPVRHPGTTLLLAALLAALSAWATSRLRIDSSLQAMFSTHDPAADAMGHVLQDFSAVDELIVLATLPPNSTDPEPLTDFAQRLRAKIQSSPSLSRMTLGVIDRADPQFEQFIRKVIGPAALYYLTDAQYAAAKQRLSGEGIKAQLSRDESLIATPGPAGQALAKALLADPLRLHEFLIERLSGAQAFKGGAATSGDAMLSPDGKSLLIRIKGTRPPTDLEYSKALADGVRDAAESVNGGHLLLEYAGAYPIAAASERAIRHDMIWSVIGSVLCLQILFLLFYRKALRLFLMAFGPVALGVLLGFAVCSLMGLRLTPMTAVLGSILAAMGIDYSIQYLACYERHRLTGIAPSEAAERGIRDVATAIVGAWATSTIGFLAIGWSSVRALREFALVGTLGLAGAFICTVLLLPPLLMSIDRRSEGVAAQGSWLRWDFMPLLTGLRRYSRLAVVASLLVLIGAVGVVVGFRGPLLPMESDLTIMHPRPNPPLEAQEHIARLFGSSPGALLIHLRADSPDQLLRIAHQAEVRLAAPSVREAGVTGVLGLATLLPDPGSAALRRNAIDPAEADRVVRDFQAALADSIFDPAKYANYADSLRALLTNTHIPAIADLNAYPALAELFLPRNSEYPTEAIAHVFVRGTLDDRQSRDRVVRAIRDALKDVPGATLTGLSVLSYDSEATVQHDLPRFLIVAALLTLLYHLIHFRQLSAALLSLVPAVFSVLCLLAVMRITGQKVNMVNLIALPLLIGIDVDYGIFIVSLGRARRRDPADTPASALSRISFSGQAVLVCAIATLFGFGSLAFTSVPGIRSLGAAVGIGIIACAAGCFFLLVPLMLPKASPPIPPGPDS